MPILNQEPDIFPENLLSAPEEGSPSDGWFAIYTLSRREKELMRRLRAQNIAHYGPMVPKRTRSPGGRIRTSYVPLFAGYVFVCCRSVINCSRSVTAIHFETQPVATVL